MKAESTIRKYMKHLRAENECSGNKQRREDAWIAEATLQWVLEKCDYTPVSLLTEEAE